MLYKHSSNPRLYTILHLIGLEIGSKSVVLYELPKGDAQLGCLPIQDARWNQLGLGLHIVIKRLDRLPATALAIARIIA